MNSKSIGNISEAKVLAKFVSLGWVVLSPFGDNERYDFVIDRGKGFERVQVKTAQLTNDCGACRFHVFSLSGSYTKIKRGYEGEVEFFAVYNGVLDKVYLVPIEICGSNQDFASNYEI